MGKTDLKSLTNSIKCLIVFEHKTAQLYEDVSEKTRNLPLLKSLMLQISLDSQKHSVVLKGLAQSLPKTNWKPNDLPKAFTDAWRTIDEFQLELADVDEIAEADLADLSRQMAAFENIMTEAYDVLVQYDNLDMMSIEMTKLYRVDTEVLKTIFMEIMGDEEHHKQILVIIQGLLEKHQVERTEATPVVRFQNPDAWSRPIMH